MATILGADGRPMGSGERNGFAGEGNGDFALPHIFTNVAVLSGADKTYFMNKWDEAMRRSRENALIMRRDAFLMSLLNERVLGTVSFPWELECPDEKDPRQVFVRDTLRTALENVRDFRRIMYALLQAVWYGRYAVCVRWKWCQVQGQQVMTVGNWYPVNGDKLGWLFDGTPYVLINSGEVQEGDGIRLVNTNSGGRGLLLDGTWREHFIIHKQEVEDADYFEPEAAARVWGVGVRDRIFWLDYIRREQLEWMSAFLERVGLGLTLWYYEGGNAKALREAQYAAKYQSRRANIFVPIFSDGKGSPKGFIERLETPVNGVDALRILNQGLEQKIERMVIGQEASSKSDGVSGLGNQSGAQFQRATKDNIIQFDARILEETITGDEDEPGLVYLMQKYSFPDTLPHLPGGFRIRFRYAIEKAEAEKKLAGIDKAIQWGLAVKADEIRAAIGLSKPDVGDEVVQSQMGMGGMDGGMPGGFQQDGGNDMDAIMGPDADGFGSGIEEANAL